MVRSWFSTRVFNGRYGVMYRARVVATFRRAYSYFWLVSRAADSFKDSSQPLGWVHQHLECHFLTAVTLQCCSLLHKAPGYSPRSLPRIGWSLDQCSWNIPLLLLLYTSYWTVYNGAGQSPMRSPSASEVFILPK